MRPALRLAVLVAASLVLSAQSWTEDRGEVGTEEDLLALGKDVAEKVGAPAGPLLRGAVLEMQTDRLSGVLRCPVCQGLSVADSPSESARNMKRQIRAMIAAGYDDDQIKDYFVGAYGEFVLMSPVKKGFNLIVWLAPVLIIVGGGLLGFRSFRGRAVSSNDSGEESSLSPVPTATTDGSLDPWLARIRDEAEKD